MPAGSLSKFLLALLLLAVVVAVWIVAQDAGTFSVRDTLGLGKPVVQAPVVPEEAGATGAPAGEKLGEKASPAIARTELDFNYLQQVIANLGSDRRREVLADAESFRQFVQQEADNHSLLMAARANRLEENANVRFLMERGAENVLRELYLRQLQAEKLPRDFPTDQQIREYYDKNKFQFEIGERMHVWQIFLPTDKELDNKAIAEIEKKAKRIVEDIRSGKLSFADAAMQNSGHEPSRLNGGYLGLVKVADMKPGIREAINKLAEGSVSDPVKSDEGFHILRRGKNVQAETVPLEKVRERIRQLLLVQAQRQFRQAVTDQARKTYPLKIQETRVEEWRLRLRTDQQATQSVPNDWAQQAN
jgi:peptidylprolyl isomerase